MPRGNRGVEENIPHPCGSSRWMWERARSGPSATMPWGGPCPAPTRGSARQGRLYDSVVGPRVS